MAEINLMKPYTVQMRLEVVARSARDADFQAHRDLVEALSNGTFMRIVAFTTEEEEK